MCVGVSSRRVGVFVLIARVLFVVESFRAKPGQSVMHRMNSECT